MARVIISHYSGIALDGAWQSTCFYDAFVEGLVEQGNDVLHVISNDFVRVPWNGTNALRPGIRADELNKAVRDFQPDLVIAFNNSTLPGIERLVDCPVALWDADSLPYFNDKDHVRQARDRYHFLAFSQFGVEQYREVLGASAARVARVPAATGVKAASVEKKYNVSFIGTYFGLHPAVRAMLDSKPRKLLDLFRLYEQQPDLDLDAARRQLGLEGNDVPLGALVGLRAGNWRNQTIAEVCPLGLKLLGTPEWYRIAPFSIDVALAYDPRLVFSLRQNERVYNLSRVSLSIAHSQNVTGYPWRVQDIMASSACLVSDRKTDLVRDFQGKVPLQLYDTPREAYDVCRRLLDEPALREDVVSASQAAIEEGHRWRHRLREIGAFTGVELCPGDRAGSVRRLEPGPFTASSAKIAQRPLGAAARAAIRALPPAALPAMAGLKRILRLDRFVDSGMQESFRKRLIGDTEEAVLFDE